MVSKKINFIVLICVSVITVNINAITLDEAIETALKKSPEILIQKQKLLEAHQEKRVKKAQNFGKINAVGSYTRYNIPRTLTPIVPPITPDVVSSREISSAGLIYEVLLFNGFADVSSVDIAELGKKISNINLSLTKEQLIYNIKSLYFKIVSLKNQKTSAISYQRALEKLYKDVKKEVEVGKKAKIDLLKVSSELENASFNVKSIENSIKTLKAKLASIIGVDEIDDVESVNDDEKFSANVDLRNSYTYKKAKFEAQKSKKAIRKAKSLYFPKIGLNTYYGSNFAKGIQEELWQAGININWRLYDFGYKDAQLQKAKIAHMVSKLRLKNTELKLKSDIIDANNRISTAIAKVQSAKKQLILLKKIKDTEYIKYEKGISDMYDLLYAIAKYQNAQSSFIEAMYDLKMQKAYLNYITAGEK
ncbi:TolC family protein [Nitrosophilus alvini]|uniref:TolC family protein n=1 Tax=Nitrosophilus alvini TaxID=2714855 RepID=UPI00190E2A3F|nr:TolC family protein [Nitrosophilus alvini]